MKENGRSFSSPRGYYVNVSRVCKFRLRGRPFSGTMDRAVNSTLEKKVQELRNCLNNANFGASSTWKTAEKSYLYIREACFPIRGK